MKKIFRLAAPLLVLFAFVMPLSAQNPNVAIRLDAIPGVAEHGLFLGMADLLLIGATSLAEAIALVPARQRLFADIPPEETLLTETWRP